MEIYPELSAFTEKNGYYQGKIYSQLYVREVVPLPGSQKGEHCEWFIYSL